MRTADLPLHYGTAPKWLFSRMVKLGSAISAVLVDEFGTEEYLQRLSDPFWFQSLSCVLGFDYHSSGTTTTTMGALKEALSKQDLGIKIAGGKGSIARRAPLEIKSCADSISMNSKNLQDLIYTSKAAAKVDSAALQDSFDLYHHCIVFDCKGNWAVVQQGLNKESRYARRYHWNSQETNNFLEEPHSAICSDERKKHVLDLTAKQSKENKSMCVDLVRENPKKIQNDFNALVVGKQRNLLNWQKRCNESYLRMPRNINWKAMEAAYDFQPSNYEQFLMLKGIGKNTVRALALISELIYGNSASWKDPVKYSFAHGGKDGVPRPVDKKAMDRSTQILGQAIEDARLNNKEKLHALRRLKEFAST